MRLSRLALMAGPGSPARQAVAKSKGLRTTNGQYNGYGDARFCVSTVKALHKPYVVATVFRPHPIRIQLPRPFVNAVNADMQYRRMQAETIIPLSVRDRTSGKWA